MSTIALVPLRGGSKSMPLKNIRPIAGKPLCVWVLEAALESGVFESVVVSTDDDRIADLVRARMPAVKIIRRPAELATDTASTESVMLHAAAELPFDALCTIQATSPLTSAEDFRAAHRLFVKSRADSLLTAVRMKRFFWEDEGSPLNYDPKHRPMRQTFKGTLMENGAFYFTTRELLEQKGCRLGGKVEIYEMKDETSTELDEPADWRIVERHLWLRSRVIGFQKVQNLRYFFFDVDGTLTDSSMYYSAHGEELKRFSTRDGHGIQRLREIGIEVGLITSEDSPIARSRAEKLNLSIVYTGVPDKVEALGDFCAKNGVDYSQIGFMGDDLNDLGAIEKCGFSACPCDAVIEVMNKVDYICAKAGGNGAVRELCDTLVLIRESMKGRTQASF
jgi:YrbI family 3-deoxy-D-manno-octulosonate 8-phosphate phosphatase